MKKMTKILALVLALVLVVACFAGCKKPVTDPTNGEDAKIEYTYRGSTTALGDNWNPHTWETSADDLSSYLQTPLATMSIKDSEKGIYQWVFKAATSVTDVTKDNQADLTKYKVTLPEGQTVEQTEKGYVFEIKLNPNMKWQDGTAINADTYIYSMKALLDPAMRNYRANLYYDGESAVAGGNAYYNSGAPLYDPMVPPYEDTPDYSFDLDAAVKAGKAYIAMDSYTTTLMGSSYSFAWMASNGYADAEIVKALSDAANPYGYTQVTAENLESVKTLISQVMSAFGVDMSTLPEAEATGLYMEGMWAFNDKYGDKVEYDATVGCYKVDDYTIRYVTQAQIDYNYFLTSCTSNWLVHEGLYEAGKDTTGALVTTDYCTKVENTMSYGPYKMESLQAEKQMVFVQNENYYEYKKNDDGTLSATTDYLVDGKNVESWKTTKVIIDVMTPEASKQAFLKGELTEWAPSADEVPNYTTSEQMYKVDETYTMRLFFHTNLDTLKTLDAEGGNVNSVVLSNKNFRKAMSFAIDRAELVTATAAYKPAYSMLSSLYFYNVYEDPASIYRNSEPAMQAICNLYGVEYGEGTPYADLTAAYKSINGYNVTEASELFKLACEELVAEGLYTEGADIKIQLGYSAGAMSAADHQYVALLNKYFNAAAEGTGIGSITIEAVDNLNNRYNDVANGVYAMGHGAWGGAAFYPYTMFQVYCDDEYVNPIHEKGSWDPATETLTMDVNGEEVTMTWKEWSRSMAGTGPFANEPHEVKLQILANLEENMLGMYNLIPLNTTTACSMLSYKMSYYTEIYSIMYGFGGLRLLNYNYTDAEWAEFVAENNGQIGY